MKGPFLGIFSSNGYNNKNISIIINYELPSRAVILTFPNSLTCHNTTMLLVAQITFVPDTARNFGSKSINLESTGTPIALYRVKTDCREPSVVLVATIAYSLAGVIESKLSTVRECLSSVFVFQNVKQHSEVSGLLKAYKRILLAK